jgi:hypothetical protein
VGIAGLSRWPLDTGSEESVFRLSWRADPIRVEACRQLTEQEIAELPAHMRRVEECTGGFADYELLVAIDDRQVLADTLSPSGLRGDRPVYVFHNEQVTPGAHRVDVSFTALIPEDVPNAEDPVTLTWEGKVTVAPREVGLLTLDPTGTALVRR